ncbi:MAG: response regulator [Alphaproteobacteria bacterium]|nr:response regulator [Alphaproteobacteria bacterium]
MGLLYGDKSVLVVDDQEFVRRIVTTMLTQIGCDKNKLATASDGTEALSAVKEKRPSLIICDINMKPMDGLEFVKTLRGDPVFYQKPIPIIFLTGEFSQEQATAAMALGCQSFLLKPVAPRKLREKLNEIFGGRDDMADD